MLGTRHVVVLLAEMKQIIEGKVEELANLESKELKELFVRNLRVELFWVLHHVLYVVFPRRAKGELSEALACYYSNKPYFVINDKLAKQLEKYKGIDSLHNRRAECPSSHV